MATRWRRFYLNGAEGDRGRNLRTAVRTASVFGRTRVCVRRCDAVRLSVREVLMILESGGQSWVSCTVKGNLITLQLDVYLDCVSRSLYKNELEYELMKAVYAESVRAKEATA